MTDTEAGSFWKLIYFLQRDGNIWVIFFCIFFLIRNAKVDTPLEREFNKLYDEKKRPYLY